MYKRPLFIKTREINEKESIKVHLPDFSESDIYPYNAAHKHPHEDAVTKFLAGHFGRFDGQPVEIDHYPYGYMFRVTYPREED